MKKKVHFGSVSSDKRLSDQKRLYSKSRKGELHDAIGLFNKFVHFAFAKEKSAFCYLLIKIQSPWGFLGVEKPLAMLILLLGCVPEPANWKITFFSFFIGNVIFRAKTNFLVVNGQNSSSIGVCGCGESFLSIILASEWLLGQRTFNFCLFFC